MAMVLRLLDGIDPEVLATITHAAQHTPGVQQVNAVRARWSGHRLHAELRLMVDPALSVPEGQAIVMEVAYQLFQQVPSLAEANIILTTSLCLA
jgi:divalent metal cation (Fe/Co/Zn/Cd) transporter